MFTDMVGYSALAPRRLGARIGAIAALVGVAAVLERSVATAH